MTRTKQLGTHFSEGSRRLWSAMKERGWKQTDLARALGKKNTGIVNRWLYGDRRPDRNSALLLQKTLGIEVTLWDAEPSEPFTVPSPAKEAA